MKELEFKSYPFAVTRTSAKDAEEQGILNGYASTWAKDSYGDRIAPGAFAQSIADRKGKYPLHAQHNISDLPVGFVTTAAEDHKGLQIEALLALNTSGGRDAFEIVKAAQAADYPMGLSIGFRLLQWEMDEQVRVLTEIELIEVSLTALPANRFARVTEARSEVTQALTTAATALQSVQLLRLRTVFSDLERRIT